MSNVTPIRPGGAEPPAPPAPTNTLSYLLQLEDFLLSHRAALATCLGALLHGDDGVAKDVAETLDSHILARLCAELERLHGFNAITLSAVEDPP